MSTPNSQPSLLAAILAATSDVRVQLAELLGASFEGGIYGPWGTTPGGPAVGDNGHSYGPFQINLPFHPGVTPQLADNPAYAAKYMTPAYTAAVGKVPAGLWRTDPALAAEEAAAMAERPAKTYLANYGRQAVDQHYATAEKVLGGKSASGGPAGAYSTSGMSGVYQNGTAQAQTAGFSLGGAFLDTLTGPFSAMFGANGFQDLVERGALIMLGGMLLIVGFIMMVKDTGPGQAVVKEGKSAAKDAALAAAV